MSACLLRRHSPRALGFDSIMKPRRAIHLIFGILATVPLVLIVASLVLTPLQNAESSRIESLGSNMQQGLEEFRQEFGHYPDSFRAGTAGRSPQYKRTDSGYELSYRGWWCHYTLSVSNNGTSVSKLIAR